MAKNEIPEGVALLCGSSEFYVITLFSIFAQLFP